MKLPSLHTSVNHCFDCLEGDCGIAVGVSVSSSKPLPSELIHTGAVVNLEMCLRPMQTDSPHLSHGSLQPENPSKTATVAIPQKWLYQNISIRTF